MMTINTPALRSAPTDLFPASGNGPAGGDPAGFASLLRQTQAAPAPAPAPAAPAPSAISPVKRAKLRRPRLKNAAAFRFG